jgi:hypothetical protein
LPENGTGRQIIGTANALPARIVSESALLIFLLARCRELEIDPDRDVRWSYFEWQLLTQLAITFTRSRVATTHPNIARLAAGSVGIHFELMAAAR